ncbi:ATP-binding protein, partial [Nocardia sp. NPDC004573]
MATIGADGSSRRRKLVGRAPEVRHLEQVLADARSGLAAGVVVVGEPGIGKTRLLGELCER